MHDVPEHFQPISEAISIGNSDKPPGEWNFRRVQTD